MRVKEIVEKLASDFLLEGYGGLNMSFNFILEQPLDNDDFHIHLIGRDLKIFEGLSENPIGILKAKESTLQALIQMGLDPLKLMMQFTMPDGAAEFSLPEIESRIHLESETTEGEEIAFDIFIDNDVLHIIEGNDELSDIEIKIKGSYLPKLIQGKFNPGMDLLTGRIKVRNKSALFQLLAKYGLKF